MVAYDLQQLIEASDLPYYMQFKPATLRSVLELVKSMAGSETKGRSLSSKKRAPEPVNAMKQTLDQSPYVDLNFR